MSPTYRFGLAAAGVRTLDADALAAARRRPGRALNLRHADEQTLAALAAADAAGFRPPDAADWAAVAATRFAGRDGVAAALGRFLAEGPWGVSPLVIPNCSPHSVSGTLSVALGLRGPNLAVEAGPDGVRGAFLVAAALLADGTPGVWVVLTHRPDAVSAAAVALALTLRPCPRAFDLPDADPLTADDVRRALAEDAP